ncbi:MAG: hypothetical protein NT020_05930 [Chloroflexales bacterium]|nr:hypothetical protein [Chloroflexales bacterium]
MAAFTVVLSESIGGLPGASRLDMDNTYWNETYAEAFDYLSANAPSNATVWIEGYSYDVPHTYQLDGRTRADLRFVSNDGYSVWGMHTMQMAMYEADYIKRPTGLPIGHRQHGRCWHRTLHRWIRLYVMACRCWVLIGSPQFF